MDRSFQSRSQQTNFLRSHVGAQGFRLAFPASRTDTGTALDVFPTHGNPNPEASPAFEAYGYNGRSEVVSSARYRGENTADTSKPLHGRARAYAYDAIGNRTSSSTPGAPSTSSAYTANALNQYTSRTVPGTLPLTGDAPLDVNVYVNGTLADRQRTHWHGLVTAGNTQSPVYAQAVTEAVYLPPDPQDPDEYTATTNHVFFAQSPEAFTYDPDGNLTSDGRFTYTWNGENRLTKAETRNDLPLDVPRYRVEYAYDSKGRMVWKEVSYLSAIPYQLTTTHYVWDKWNIISETSVSPTPNSSFLTTNFTHYVWGKDISGGLQRAGGVGGLLAVVRDDGIYSPCYDANGNVTEYVVLETSTLQLETVGGIVAHYEYDPFGSTVAQSGTMAGSFAFRFSTKPWCKITGISHYGMRPYRPSIGGWINRDPIYERGGANLYGMVGNNAVNWIDPLGLKLQIIIQPANDPDVEKMRQNIESYLSTICDTISIKDGGFSFVTGPSQTPKGCCCLQQLIESDNTWTITAQKMTDPAKQWPKTTDYSEQGLQNPDGSPGRGTGGSVYVPVEGGGIVWPSYDKNGELRDAPNWRVLAHELCGHANFLDKGIHDPRGGKRGNRPEHDQAINAENEIAAEHPGEEPRGLYDDPEHGESGYRKL